MTFLGLIFRGWLLLWMLLLSTITTSATNSRLQSSIVRRTVSTTAPTRGTKVSTIRINCPSIKDSTLTCHYKKTTNEGECALEKESSLCQKSLNIKEIPLIKIFNHSVTFPVIPNILHHLDVCLVVPEGCPQVCLYSEIVSDAFLSDDIKKDFLGIKDINENQLILSIKNTKLLNQIKLSNITLNIIQPHTNQIVKTKTLTNGIENEIVFGELDMGFKYRLELLSCNPYKCNESGTLYFVTLPAKPLVNCSESTPNSLDFEFEADFEEDQIEFNLEFQMGCHESCRHSCPLDSTKFCREQNFTKIKLQANYFIIRISDLKPFEEYSMRFRKYTSNDNLDNPTERLESEWSEVKCSTKVGKPQLVGCPSNVLEVNENLTEIKISQSFSQKQGPLKSILLILDSTHDKIDQTPCHLEIPLFNTRHISNIKYPKKKKRFRKLNKCRPQRIALQSGPKCKAITANEISIFNSRSYSMKLRAYTSTETFTDSSAVVFEMTATHDHTFFIIIMIIITTILIFIIIILLTCVYYYKKKNDTKIVSLRKKNTLPRPSSIFGKFIATKTSRLSSYISHPVPKSKPVKLDDFLEMEKEMNKDSGLKFTEEFEDLRHVGKDQSEFTSKRNINSAKNRYANILTYEDSRVELPMLEGDDSSDYINANWIPTKGFHSSREFIATQGPLEKTINDFWRMVWSHESSVLVMLTQCMENTKVKCSQYWCEDEDGHVYGDIEVKMISETDNDLCYIRKFQLTSKDEVRIIQHFHFLSWPDMGVPDSNSLISLQQLCRNLRLRLSNQLT